MAFALRNALTSADAQPRVAPPMQRARTSGHRRPRWLGTRLVEAWSRGLPTCPRCQPPAALRCLVRRRRHPALAIARERDRASAGDVTDPASLGRLRRRRRGRDAVPHRRRDPPARVARLRRGQRRGHAPPARGRDGRGRAARRARVVELAVRLQPDTATTLRRVVARTTRTWATAARKMADGAGWCIEAQARGRIETVVDPAAVVLRAAPAAATDALLHDDQGRAASRCSATAATGARWRTSDNICQGLLLAAARAARERRHLLDRRRAAVLDQRDRRHGRAACSSTTSGIACSQQPAAAARAVVGVAARWRTARCRPPGSTIRRSTCSAR